MTSFFKFEIGKSCKRILLLTHRHADADALCSAAVLKSLLDKQFKVEIGIPDSLNSEAKRIAKKFNVSVSLNPKLKRFDCIILVEVSSKEMLGSLKKEFQSFEGKKYLIDHHAVTKFPGIPSSHKMLDSKAISTTELLFHLLYKSPVKLTGWQANLLALGLMSDSAQFTTATPFTFLAMYFLLSHGDLSYADLKALLSPRHDFSGKIASLKAVKGARIFRLGSFVAVNVPSGSGSDVLDQLIVLGADIAVQTIEHSDHQTVLTVHANNYFISKTHINLTKNVVQVLATLFKGSFGGHQAVANFSCFNVHGEEVLNAFLNELLLEIKKQDK
jgi:nanoRNase/pAp phosphatase (c-di-AMP/oligoRNAs hydrolase)